MTAEAFQQERRRIGRKARRYANRNKKGGPAKFALCEASHPGLVLQPNLIGEFSLVNAPLGTPKMGINSLTKGEKMKFSKKIALALTTFGVFVAGNASAAVDTAVTTALTTAGTDGASIGSAVLVVLVGIVAFKYLRRAL